MKLFLKESLGYYCYYGDNGEHKYYHRLVAEKKIGRPLLDEECVHHIDHNKLNNEPDNLMVFKTKKCHSTHHSYPNIKLIENEDGTFSFPYELLYYPCKNCGKDIKEGDFCCPECYRDFVFNNSKIPTKEELEQLILNNTFVSIGNLYGVSDNCVRNWCKKYGLPTTIEEKKAHLGWKRPSDSFVCELYKKHQSLIAVSKETSLSVEEVKKILKKQNIRRNGRSRKIKLVKLNIEFDNSLQCAEWLISNNYTYSDNKDSIVKSIIRVANKERKSYLGLDFSYAD